MPVGAICANWSKVRVSPPALWILALAELVNFKATILKPVGTVVSLTSLVTVPTTATILDVNRSNLPSVCLLESLVKNLVTMLITLPRPEGELSCCGINLSLDKILVILDREIGYLFNLDWFNLFKIVLLNLESVLRARKE